jgi:hypothetical protein
MDIVQYLLDKNLIPIINHENGTYRFLEVEAAKATRGILGRKGNFYVLKSARSNAYTTKINDSYVICITDSLINDIESAILNLIRDPSIVDFFQDEFSVTYPSVRSYAKITTGFKSETREINAQDPFLAMFFEIFDHAMRFILLHEIAHISNNHLDEFRKETGHQDIYQKISNTLELLTYGGSGDNRFTRHHEFIADREAGNWLIQNVIRRLSQYFDQGIPINMLALHSTISLFGAMVSIIYTSRQCNGGDQEYTFDHPTYETRLESVWEGIEPPFNELLDAQTETLMLKHQLLQMITALRSQIETIVFGARSKYMISF